MPSQNPLRTPLHPAIDENMVKAVVHGFYDKVRADAVLGPVFDRVIGGEWGPHLEKMCDFWSSVMMMSGRYKGNPMTTHMRLKQIRIDHFERWLCLFRETAGEICPADVAPLFIGRAENIARSLQMGMFFRSGPNAGPPEQG